MKRFVSLVAVLLFIMTSVNAFGLTAAEANKMSNTKLYNEMKALGAEAMAEFWNDVYTSGSATLKSRVKTQLAKLLNSKTGDDARSYVHALYEGTTTLSFTLGSTGKYTVTVGERTEAGVVDNGTGYIPRTEDVISVSQSATSSN